MKAILAAGMLLIAAQARADQFDHTHKLFASVLKAHVRGGLVDYPSLQTQRAQLDLYLLNLSSVTEGQFNAWDKPQQIAYLLNLYNAATLAVVIDHYPVKGIKEIGGMLKSPWDLPLARLFGEKTTLNEIQHKILRRNYGEPRIHFALVCAAKGAPPLREEPYEAKKLEQQLEDQGRRFFLQKDKNRVDGSQKKLILSPIFHWYRGDFEGKAESVENFIQAYLPVESLRELGRNRYGTGYSVYDWSLNEATPKKAPAKKSSKNY